MGGRVGREREGRGGKEVIKGDRGMRIWALVYDYLPDTLIGVETLEDSMGLHRGAGGFI